MWCLGAGRLGTVKRQTSGRVSATYKSTSSSIESATGKMKLPLGKAVGGRLTRQLVDAELKQTRVVPQTRQKSNSSYEVWERREIEKAGPNEDPAMLNWTTDRGHTDGDLKCNRICLWRFEFRGAAEASV